MCRGEGVRVLRARRGRIRELGFRGAGFLRRGRWRRGEEEEDGEARKEEEA
jgi:hypothetical protein